jgi:hypothetical protein
MGVPRMRNPKTVAKEMVGFYHGIQRYKYVYRYIRGFTMNLPSLADVWVN